MEEARCYYYFYEIVGDSVTAIAEFECLAKIFVSHKLTPVLVAVK